MLSKFSKWKAKEAASNETPLSALHILDGLCQQSTMPSSASSQRSHLPGEILQTIFALLDPGDLLNAMRVSKDWNEQANWQIARHPTPAYLIHKLNSAPVDARQDIASKVTELTFIEPVGGKYRYDVTLAGILDMVFAKEDFISLQHLTLSIDSKEAANVFMRTQDTAESLSIVKAPSLKSLELSFDFVPLPTLLLSPAFSQLRYLDLNSDDKFFASLCLLKALPHLKQLTTVVFHHEPGSGRWDYFHILFALLLCETLRHVKGKFQIISSHFTRLFRLGPSRHPHLIWKLALAGTRTDLIQMCDRLTPYKRLDLVVDPRRNLRGWHGRVSEDPPADDGSPDAMMASEFTLLQRVSRFTLLETLRIHFCGHGPLQISLHPNLLIPLTTLKNLTKLELSIPYGFREECYSPLGPCPLWTERRIDQIFGGFPKLRYFHLEDDWAILPSRCLTKLGQTSRDLLSCNIPTRLSIKDLCDQPKGEILFPSLEGLMIRGLEFSDKQ